MFLLTVRPSDIVYAVIINDTSDMVRAIDPFGNEGDVIDSEVDHVLSILGINRFHQLCNTVRTYDFDSRRAAWIKYSAIYVEERISAERAKAYETHIARPHFGPLVVSSTRPTFKPDAVRMLVAAFQRS